MKFELFYLGKSGEEPVKVGETEAAVYSKALRKAVAAARANGHHNAIPNLCHAMPTR